MIFKAENVGVVYKCEIDLSKKLIIFTGPNNTGKTYIAHTIYGLFRKQYRINILPKLRNHLSANISKNEGKIDLIELFENYNFFNQISKSYTKTLPLIFASPESNFENSTIEINETLEKLREIFSEKEIEKTSIGFQNYEIIFHKKKKSTYLEYYFISSGNKIEGKSIKNKEIIFANLSRGIVVDIIIDIVLGLLLPKVFIAPAERMAINIFNKELSVQRNVLLDKLLELGASSNKKTKDDPFDILNRRATRYPLPIRESLEIADDITNYKKKTSRFSYLAEELETNILDGQIVITRDGEVEYRPNKNKSKKLSMHLTASMVKSLSNLVIYFRHLAETGDYIIIDEPELNLHPDNQILLSRWISRIIKEGFKVIITTHSDYILNELNVHILLSKYKSRNKLPFNYKKENIMKPEEVGVYLFNYPNKNSRKTKVKALEVTENGFEVNTIDEVINSLNRRIHSLNFETFE